MKPKICLIIPALLTKAEAIAEKSPFAHIRVNPRTGHQFLVFDPAPIEQPFVMRRRHVCRLFGVSSVYGWSLCPFDREVLVWLTDEAEEQPLVKIF